jgi:hypothetical protein
MNTTHLKRLLLAISALALGTLVAAPAGAKMVSQKVDGVCLTTGGGKFVDVPGFPGERIDRRLLPDLKFLERKYKIFLVDGYSNDPVHAGNGEHPIGLAADIVPNTAEGGSWRLITALAHYAEPTQDHPIPPFRWVGYDGDAGHGRGNHLHLSWNHSDTRPGVPADSVYTMICPGSKAPKGGNGGPTTPSGGGDPGNGGDPGAGDGGKPEHHTPAGGIKPTGSSSGGISIQRIRREIRNNARHPVREPARESLR